MADDESTDTEDSGFKNSDVATTDCFSNSQTSEILAPIPTMDDNSLTAAAQMYLNRNRDREESEDSDAMDPEELADKAWRSLAKRFRNK